jgi:hypothetical protein
LRSAVNVCSRPPLIAYPTLSPTVMLEMMREMAPVPGDRAEAIRISDTMARLMIGLQYQFGPERAGQLHREIRDAVRAAELAGNSGSCRRS